jgi:hypothetical protein
VNVDDNSCSVIVERFESRFIGFSDDFSDGHGEGVGVSAYNVGQN